MEINGKNFDTSAKGLKKKLGSIVRRAGTLQADMHAYLMGAFGHLAEHGQKGPAMGFFTGMPKGVRVEAAKLWAEHYFPVRFSTNKETNEVTLTLKKGWKAEDFNFAEADMTPFWAHSKENEPPKNFDLLKWVETAIGQINRKTEAGLCPEHTARIVTNDLSALVDALKRAETEKEEARAEDASEAYVAEKVANA